MRTYLIGILAFCVMIMMVACPGGGGEEEAQVQGHQPDDQLVAVDQVPRLKQEPRSNRKEDRRDHDLDGGWCHVL